MFRNEEESLRAGTAAAGKGPWQARVLRSLQAQEEVLNQVLAALDAADYPECDRFAVRLALEEALVNAVVHGHRGDPRLPVQVRWHVAAGQVVVEVEDQGPGFDPAQVPDPRAGENLERPSGRGLLFMRTFTTWVRHNERGNRVTLCRRRSPRA